MTRRAIKTDEAPKAAGPYSQAILHSETQILELSGQIGINPETGKLVEGGIVAETQQAMANIKAILNAAGWGYSEIVKIRIYIIDMKDYQVVNEIYAKSFISEPPARVAVAVKQLPLGALVEIECSAAGEKVSL